MTNKVSRIAIICALEECIRDEVKRMCDTDALAELDTMALHAKENIKMLQSVKYKSLVKESTEVVKDLVKTENSSEKPNNCEECKHWNDTEDDCADRHGCRATTEDWQDWKDRMWSEAIVTEPTTEDCSTVPTSSKMEQVDEPQTCSVNGRPYTDCCNCEYFKCTADEPQTERSSE